MHKHTTRDKPPRHVRKDDADAFIRHPDDDAMRTDDALAETLGEEFVRSATSGEDVDDTLFLDEEVTEEIGGPFVVSSADVEFATDDNGLGEDAEAAERPQAVDSLSQPPGSDVEPARVRFDANTPAGGRKGASSTRR